MELLDFRNPVSAWTHLLWMILAVPGSIVLYRRTRGDRAKQISLLVFGLSLFLCFLASTVYHAVRLSPENLRLYVTLDYCGIYLLIAGTCTGIVFTLLDGWWRWGVLGSVWALAIAGMVLRVIHFGEVPPGVSAPLYLAMGWGLVSCYPELARRLPHRDLRLIPLGGLAYSVGAGLFLLDWPVLWPGVIEAHEVFHVFVMLGSLAHYVFVLKHVVPFERSVEAVEAALEPVLAPE